MTDQEIDPSNLTRAVEQLESLLRSLSKSKGAARLEGLAEALSAASTLKEAADSLVDREVVELGYQEVSDALRRIEATLKNALNTSAGKGRKSEIEEGLGTVSSLASAARDFFVETNQSDPNQAWQEILRQPRRLPGFDSPPTFIIGYRRSGTTLLAWLLNSHPRLAALPENEICYRFFEPPHPASPSRYPVAVQIQTAAEELGEGRAHFYDRVAALINGIFSSYARRQGKKRWVSKEIFLSQSLDLLDLAFGYCGQFIYIARHGFDVALSASKRFGALSGAPRQSLDIRTYLQEWVESNEASLDFMERNPERVHLLRYEDFVAQPESVAKGVFEFLDEDWQKDIFEVMQSKSHPPLGDNRIYQTGGRILSNRKGRWENWPPALLRQLNQLAGPTLKRFGYEEIEG